MGFCRQEYWSGLPFPSAGIFPTQGSNLPVNIHVLISLTHVLTLKWVLGLGRGAWCLVFFRVKDELIAAAEGGLAVNDDCLRAR